VKEGGLKEQFQEPCLTPPLTYSVQSRFDHCVPALAAGIVYVGFIGWLDFLHSYLQLSSIYNLAGTKL
jgi:hypothetical protein